MSKKRSRLEIRVAGLLIKDGRLLLVRHERRGETYWVTPGGHVETGETLAETLVREFREEVGLEVTVGDIVMVNDFVRSKKQVLNLYLLVKPADGRDYEPGETGDRGISEFAWFDGAALGGLNIRPSIAEELKTLLAGGSLNAVYLGTR